MSEVNYNETVVLPLFQRKYQELMNSNLILEINLLVEQTKNRDLIAKVQELEQKVQSLSKRKKRDEQILDGQSY